MSGNIQEQAGKIFRKKREWCPVLSEEKPTRKGEAFIPRRTSSCLGERISINEDRGKRAKRPSPRKPEKPLYERKHS